MEDHLDMHFKQNRKANQNIGRGHSRSWFVGVDVRCFSFSSLVQLTDGVPGLGARCVGGC
jgi:hypothetical protein